MGGVHRKVEHRLIEDGGADGFDHAVGAIRIGQTKEVSLLISVFAHQLAVAKFLRTRLGFLESYSLINCSM